jgi:hypothetical protein
MSDVDLSAMSIQQTKESLGELVRLALQARGAVVLIQRADGVLTSVDPKILDQLSAEQVVPFLLSWPEEMLSQYLMDREGK